MVPDPVLKVCVQFRTSLIANVLPVASVCQVWVTSGDQKLPNKANLLATFFLSADFDSHPGAAMRAQPWGGVFVQSQHLSPCY